METFVVLLRGINVSGANKIKMADLKKLLTKSGFEDPETYIQSGNILLSSDIDEDGISEKIKNAIQEEYGYDITVKSFTRGHFQSILDNNPLPDEHDDELKKFHVTLLAEKPSEEAKEKIKARKKESEIIVFKDNQVYLYCPEGYGRTKLSNNDIERITKSAATTRNWKTMLQLKKMLEDRISE